MDASITPDRLENMVAKLSMTQVITFVDNEIPKGNTMHDRAIYIIACPKQLYKGYLGTLGVPSDYMKPNPCDIRAFNNSVNHDQ